MTQVCFYMTPLLSKDLTDFPGKEGLMITVEYPAGGSDPIHHHNAHAFVYVLEGSIVMQVRGGKEVTLTPGQTFYEGPSDVHVVGRNASQTKPAQFVVFLVNGPARRSRRQCRLTLLQEAADGGVALETDCDFVRVAGFVVCTCLGQQLCACRPVGLVFGEPPIGGYRLHGVESGAGTMRLRDRQGAIDSDHR
jgi:quercetin dioxygenase-like cupin family protein